MYRASSCFRIPMLGRRPDIGRIRRAGLARKILPRHLGLTNKMNYVYSPVHSRSITQLCSDHLEHTMDHGPCHGPITNIIFQVHGCFIANYVCISTVEMAYMYISNKRSNRCVFLSCNGQTRLLGQLTYEILPERFVQIQVPLS
jgi:hypothetical protein